MHLWSDNELLYWLVGLFMAHLFMMCFRILEQREKKKIYILKSKFKLKKWTTKKRELPLSFLHSFTKITTLCNSVSGSLLAWMLSTQKQQKRNSFLELYMCWTLGKKIRHIVDRSHPPCTYPVLNYETVKRESKSELSSRIRRVKPETGSCPTQPLIRNSWKNFHLLSPIMTSGSHPVQTSCSSSATSRWLPRTMCRQLLNFCRKGSSTPTWSLLRIVFPCFLVDKMPSIYFDKYTSHGWRVGWWVGLKGF